MRESQKPIGFFDSGVGGISVLQQAIKILPGEDYIYLGDNKNVPYGNKSEDEIKHLALECGDFLYDKGVKAIVIACNTATSIAVIEMRAKYNIPVISIEPAVKPALESQYCGKILVMATPATLTQSRYHKLISRLGHRERIIDIPCGRLAGMIEKFEPDTDEICGYITEKLFPFRNITVAGIVLGCTHYSFIEKQIYDIAKDIFVNNFGIYDGKYGVANHLKSVLESKGLLNDRGRTSVEFYATGDQSELSLFEKFLLK